MSESTTWKEVLADRMPDELGREVDIFATQIELRKQDKIDDTVFAETRLRRGVYGQRYDNGKRFDGSNTQVLEFPERRPGQGAGYGVGRAGDAEDQDSVRGSDRGSTGCAGRARRGVFGLYSAHYHAPGRPAALRPHRRYARSHVPPGLGGHHNPRSLRQYGPKRDRLPPFRRVPDRDFRRDALCPGLLEIPPGSQRRAGLRPEVQDRFFRMRTRGLRSCQYARHRRNCGDEVGRTAAEKRGFRFYVGGGLGAVPHQAKLFEDFLPEEELLPVSQAISRVFARLGEKRNRARARLKFLIAKLGLEEFKRLVTEERKVMPDDPEWTAYLSDLHAYDEKPLKIAQPLNGAVAAGGFRGVDPNQRLPAAPGRLRGGYGHAAARRPHVRPDAGPGQTFQDVS